MPIIHVELIEGRSEEKIQRMIEAVTDTVSQTLEAPKESIRVIVAEVPKTRYAIGGVTAKKLGR